MPQFREMDSRVGFKEQLADDGDGPVVLAILFTVDPQDAEAFKAAWAEDAAFTKTQPGFLSAQLHQGIRGSSMFLDYAVFETAEALEATTRQPEFGPLRELYPDGVTAQIHLFRKVAIPGICVGEAEGRTPSPAVIKDAEGDRS